MLKSLGVWKLLGLWIRKTCKQIVCIQCEKSCNWKVKSAQKEVGASTEEEEEEAFMKMVTQWDLKDNETLQAGLGTKDAFQAKKTGFWKHSIMKEEITSAENLEQLCMVSA